MKFGQIFIGINILMNHQSSGASLKILDIPQPVQHSGLSSQAPYESSGVVFPIANENMKEKLEQVQYMDSESKKIYGSSSITNSELHHRKLGVGQVMSPPPTQQFDRDQVSSISPTNEEIEWVKEKHVPCCDKKTEEISIAVGVPLTALAALGGFGMECWKQYKGLNDLKEPAETED